MNRLPPAIRWLLIFAGIGLTGFVAWRIRSTLGALAAGFILAYALEPLVSWLERHRVPRGLGVALIGVGVLGIFVFSLMYAIPEIIRQVQEFSATVNLDKLFDPKAWPDSVRQYLASHQEQIQGYRQKAVEWFTSHAGAVLAMIGKWLAGLTTSVVGLVVFLLNLVVVPVIGFYLLMDFGRIKAGAAALVPESARETSFRLAGEVDQVLQAFIRGQFGVALAMGVLYAIGLAILGTPLGILVGLAAGLLSLVPYLGLAAGLVPAMLLNFLGHQSWPRVLGVLVVFIIVQNIEGWILTPRMLGTAIGLHPVIVMLAIMVGGELFGFSGILLAVPATAALSVFWHEGLARYRRSQFFLGKGGCGGPAAGASSDVG